MIIGNLHNLSNELPFLPEAVQKGVKYLAETDFGSLAEGRYPIDGDKILAIVSNYTPQPWENCKAETHIKYIDVQFVAAGEELLGYAPRSDAQEILEDCTPQKDAVYYKTVAGESFIHLSSGAYAVIFPWDIHRPGCSGDHQAEVKKVVLKIALDLV